MVAFAHQVANLRAIFGVEKGGGQGTVPPGHNGIDKAGFVSLSLAVVRKYGFIAREESAHEDKVPILVQIDAHDFQSLRSILLGEIVQHGIFVATRLAPRGPESHQEWLPFMLLQ